MRDLHYIIWNIFSFYITIRSRKAQFKFRPKISTWAGCKQSLPAGCGECATLSVKSQGSLTRQITELQACTSVTGWCYFSTTYTSTLPHGPAQCLALPAAGCPQNVQSDNYLTTFSKHLTDHPKMSKVLKNSRNPVAGESILLLKDRVKFPIL